MLQYVDWSVTGEFLSGLGAVLGAFAIVYAACLARETFGSWAKKETFKSNREHAVSILVAFEKARFALKEVRSPAMYPLESEIAEAKLRQPGATPTNFQIGAQVILDRLASKQTEWDRIFDLMPVAKVLFSTDARDNLFEIFLVRQQVWAAAMSYPSVGSEPNLRKEIEQTMWLLDNETDPLLKRLEDTNEALTKLLQESIRGERKQPEQPTRTNKAARK
jgi:hypothetical protein